MRAQTIVLNSYNYQELHKAAKVSIAKYSMSLSHPFNIALSEMNAPQNFLQ